MVDSFSARQFADQEAGVAAAAAPPPAANQPDLSHHHHRHHAPGEEPVIPEPDYDLSDTEGGVAASSCNHKHASSSSSSSTIREGSQTMGRKKKKSVSFAPTDEVAKIGAGKGGRESRPESILKDPAR